MNARFILANGKIIDSEKVPFLPELIRSNVLRIEEVFWFCRGLIPFFEDHIVLLKEQANRLNASYPEFMADRNELKRIIHRLINKNKAFHSGLAHMVVAWNSIPPDVFITVEPWQSARFELRQEGLLIDYAEEVKYSGNRFNAYRFFNIPLWNQVMLKSHNQRINGPIILNEREEVVEYPEANIFFITDNSLVTPSADTGCYLDPAREKILESAVALGLKTIETSKLNKTHVAGMDEVFIAGESTGMQKIMGIGNKRFTHTQTALLNNQLNRLLFPD